MRFWSLLCITLAVPLLGSSPDVQRLSPSSFTAVPRNVVDWLTKQGCSIPQEDVSPDRTPVSNNLISGEFAAQGQKDWAALCSRKGSSSIVVLWGGESRCESALARMGDSLYMQKGSDGKFVYSRLISPIGQQQILERQRMLGVLIQPFGSPTPSGIVHHGIDDVFVGKASVTHYCYQGKWRRLQGAD